MGLLSVIDELFGFNSDQTEEKSISKEKKKITGEVLVIDDDQIARKSFQRLLQREFDAKVITFAHGVEGLRYAKKHKPGVIILDLMLPELDGFDILEKIRSISALDKSKVMLVSAKSKSEYMNEGREHFADAYMTKPFKSNHLFTRIRKLL